MTNEDSKIEDKSNKAQSFLDWSKVLAVIFSFVTVFSGLFGLGFQKGILLEMRFGNLSGAYEVDEVLNSAVIGYIHIFSKLVNSQPYDWHSLALALVVFSAVMAIFVFIYRLPNSPVQGFAKKQKHNIKNLFSDTWWARYFTALAVFDLAFISGALATLIAIAFFRLLVLLLIPSLLGFTAGGSYVDTLRKEPPCKEIQDTMVKPGQVFIECPQIVLRGKRLSGEVVLETNEGYFIRVNNGFLYALKEKDGCIYSRFYLNEENQEQAFKGYQEQQIEKFCSIQ